MAITFDLSDVEVGDELQSRRYVDVTAEVVDRDGDVVTIEMHFPDGKSFTASATHERLEDHWRPPLDEVS